MAFIKHLALESPNSFHPDRFDAAECRRLRLALGLNADKMAVVANFAGRRDWLAVEAGYEAMEAGRWALCLVELDAPTFPSAATCPLPAMPPQTQRVPISTVSGWIGDRSSAL